MSLGNSNLLFLGCLVLRRATKLATLEIASGRAARPLETLPGDPCGAQWGLVEVAVQSQSVRFVVLSRVKLLSQ